MIRFGDFQLTNAVFVFDAQAFCGVSFGGIIFRNLAEAGEGGLIGGKIAAKNMTKLERIARAKKAAAASAKVRTAKAKKKGSKIS